MPHKATPEIVWTGLEKDIAIQFPEFNDYVWIIWVWMLDAKFVAVLGEVGFGGSRGAALNGHFWRIPPSPAGSFVNTLQPWNEIYGSGSASGDIITEMKNLTLGLAHEISAEFLGSTIANGLMGLSKTSRRPVIWSPADAY
ncbi:hypothetical protein B0H13DRAFT_1863877 [Mycena leptocephala]|nr:hypothetical protein B0H13DRAFT_1863877 [Mycena leptocephala]